MMLPACITKDLPLLSSHGESSESNTFANASWTKSSASRLGLNAPAGKRDEFVAKIGLAHLLDGPLRRDASLSIMAGRESISLHRIDHRVIANVHRDDRA